MDGSRIAINEEPSGFLSKNYRKLLQLLPGLHDLNGPAKLTALGHNDVNIDVIERHKHRLILRMSHYLERLHGAAIPDPDMTIEVYLMAETVGVLTYCDASDRGKCSALS